LAQAASLRLTSSRARLKADPESGRFVSTAMMAKWEVLPPSCGMMEMSK
jgi:hypothetical protein